MQVSEWRHGEVGESELAGLVVIKPLAGQGSQAQPSAEGDGHVEHEEEEEEEGADLLHPTLCGIVVKSQQCVCVCLCGCLSEKPPARLADGCLSCGA